MKMKLPTTGKIPAKVKLATQPTKAIKGQTIANRKGVSK